LWNLISFSAAFWGNFPVLHMAKLGSTARRSVQHLVLQQLALWKYKIDKKRCLRSRKSKISSFDYLNRVRTWTQWFGKTGSGWVFDKMDQLAPLLRGAVKPNDDRVDGLNSSCSIHWDDRRLSHHRFLYIFLQLHKNGAKITIFYVKTCILI
jgi:hypothetical protein